MIANLLRKGRGPKLQPEARNKRQKNEIIILALELLETMLVYLKQD